MPKYLELLESLRQAFPQPVSAPIHDAYFVYSISRALDRVDKLKSQAPILGERIEPNWKAARDARVAEKGHSLEQVIGELVQSLQGMTIWGHPASQVNVVPPPSIASIIGFLLPATYNPNLVSEEGARCVAEVELRATSMAAELVGYDPDQAGGLFTFGGTGAMLYAVRIGLEKALPGTHREGLREKAAILTSDQGHYSALNVAGWLGLGLEQVQRARTGEDNAIDIDALETALRDTLEQGTKIAAIISTMGSTDAFGLDNLKAIVELRDRLVNEFQLDYRPHVHADAVIGWAWSVFRDYDFTANALGFRGRTIRALASALHELQHLAMADSIGIDFHKTGYTPYVSSLILFRNQNDLASMERPRETMPYLFQSGEYHPGMYTLETTGAGTGPMAALANFLLFGKQGLRVLLGNAVGAAEALREQLEAHPNLTVLNGQNVGPVTLFRVYPPGVDTFTVKQHERHDPEFRDQLLTYNAFNRRVFNRMHSDAMAGHGVALSMTDGYRTSDYGEPIAALKSYVLSPFANEARMGAIVEHVLEALEAVHDEDQRRETT